MGVKKAAILVSALALSVSLLVMGCGTKKESSRTTPVNTATGKELQITNVQLFQLPYQSSSSPKVIDVVFKATNPYKDYYSYNTYVKFNLYDSSGKIVGTDNGCIWSVYPGSRWGFMSVSCVGDPVKVETHPETPNWRKIAPANIPKATITQSTSEGSQVVGSLKYEGSSTPTQIQITGVILDANGSVINHGVTQIQNPTVGDNAFNLIWTEQGNTAGRTEFSFEFI